MSIEQHQIAGADIGEMFAKRVHQELLAVIADGIAEVITHALVKLEPGAHTKTGSQVGTILVVGIHDYRVSGRVDDGY